MDREKSCQLELFSQAQGAAGNENRRSSNLFLTGIRNYEKGILIIMAMVVTGIISFSLGMEKGKSLAVTKAPAAAIKSPSVPAAGEKAGDNRLIREEKANIRIKEETPSAKEYYIIQLGSYKDKSAAQKEAEQLKKRGFAGKTRSKGTFTVLYVGNFTDKTAAALLQSQLKKQYRDCYIRKGT